MIELPINLCFNFLAVYLHRQQSSPGPFVSPFCSMTGQLRPPPAHQPLPAHFNTTPHIAIRQGNLHSTISNLRT